MLDLFYNLPINFTCSILVTHFFLHFCYYCETRLLTSTRLWVTNRCLGQTGNFSTQINPVITTKNGRSRVVRYNRVWLYVCECKCKISSQNVICYLRIFSPYWCKKLLLKSRPWRTLSMFGFKQQLWSSSILKAKLIKIDKSWKQ